ncbi:low specificity L-threonine aldolase, partial [bacterium]|nr:low specificity L-threonine aldolase [bacterium]
EPSRAGLLMPSETMTTQFSLAVHPSPGDEVYCEATCHIRNFEGGAPGYLSGVMLNAIQGDDGAFTAENVKPLIRPLTHHFPPSRLIWVENTANWAGGAIFPQQNVLDLRKLADEHKLGLHLDGARIWNASAATGLSLMELAALFDSVSVCFSKGLGCPVGSLLAGSREFVNEAHRIRKRLGGGMRQAGILAAAVIYALDNNRERLKEDHMRAQIIADSVASSPQFEIDVASVQTNIIIFKTKQMTGAEVAEKFKSNGILCAAFGNTVRLVTHLGIGDEDVLKTISIIEKYFT